MATSGTTGDCVWSISNTGVLTVSGQGRMEDYQGSNDAPWKSSGIDITEVIVGEGVTHVGRLACISCPSLTKVTLPSTLQSVGQTAFSGNNNLTNLITNSTFSVDQRAFASCGLNIESISVKDVGESAFLDCKISSIHCVGGTSIGDQAFSKSGATTITFTDTYKTIGAGAFNQLGKISELILPQSLTTIGKNAFLAQFQNVGENIDTLVIPDNVTSIGENAFYNLTISTVTIGESVSSIGSSAFGSSIRRIINRSTLVFTAGSTDQGGIATYCTQDNITGNPTNIVQDGYWITYRQDGGNTCTITKQVGTSPTHNLNAFSINGNTYAVKSIARNAFENNSTVCVLSIGDNVQSIGARAFSNCTALTELTIGMSIRDIGDNAFDGCTALTRIWFNAVECKDKSQDEFVFNNAGINGEGIEVKFGPNVKHIPGQIFYPTYNEDNNDPTGYAGVPKIKSISFGGAEESIGPYALACNSRISAVYLPQSLTTIGNGAFLKWIALSSISLGKNINTIGSNAFAGCRAITNLTLDTNAVLGFQTFALSELVSLTIGDNVTQIFSSSFTGCTKLRRVQLGKSVTTIGANAFMNCGALSEINIPLSVTRINEDAFFNCTSLDNVVIPSSVTQIGYKAFGETDVGPACTRRLQLQSDPNITQEDNEPFSVAYAIGVPYKTQNAHRAKLSSRYTFFEITNLGLRPYIKDADGKWKVGVAYIKTNDGWRKGSKVYIKQQSEIDTNTDFWVGPQK